MLSKILLTALIIGAVLLFFKKQNRPSRQTPRQEIETVKSLSPKALTYTVVGLLVVTSIGLFAYKYQTDNKLLLLNITSSNGQTTQYIVKKKDLHGREFTTTDGKFVTIGAGDRIEIEEK